MPVNKYFLIMNPLARCGKAAGECAKIVSLLKQTNTPFCHRISNFPGEATQLALEATKQQYETVVAVGGDGTICEVINGIFAEGTPESKPKLGVLHVGTSPDFNKCHGIPVETKKAIDVLLAGRNKLIDLSKVTYFSDAQNKVKAVSYFASNVNIGLGPLIAGKANSRYRKYLGDFLGTLGATLVSLINFRCFDLLIKIDEKDESFNSLINLTVGKDPYLASGMRVFSKISSADGLLYILAIEKNTWPAILSKIPSLYCGDFLNYPGAKIFYGKSVEVPYCRDYPAIEFDGDRKGYLPALIEVIPKALNIIIP